MKPRIEHLTETKLVGMKTIMSFANNKTHELWKNLMPRRSEISDALGNELYSVEIYPNASFFENFNPRQEFEKWAAVRVSDVDYVPQGMNTLIIPEGKYAVFHYKGKPSEAQPTFQFIFGQWLPSSEYVFDGRPYFALMGDKYKGEDPDSEEELWVPIKKK